MHTRTVNGKTIGQLEADGPPVASEADALDLVVGATYGLDIDWVVIPKERLAPDFFRLRTGLLGAITQKFSNYGISAIVVGDISAEIAASDAFRDYVRETNAGRRFVFVPDEAALAAFLG